MSITEGKQKGTKVLTENPRPRPAFPPPKQTADQAPDAGSLTAAELRMISGLLGLVLAELREIREDIGERAIRHIREGGR